MTTGEKAIEIVERIVAVVNEQPPGGDDLGVGFYPDWGGNSLTVRLRGGHTHVGMDDASLEHLIDQLHSLLTGGPGLSIFPDEGLKHGS